MPGDATKLGPFTGGLHNSSGSGEFIENEELYELTNLEVDTDGSLANRPEIHMFNITGMNTYGCSFIGTYLPSDGRKFLVVYNAVDDKVHLVDANSGVSVNSTPGGLTSVCSIQYSNRLWVVARTGSTNNGGYFDAPTPSTTTWTAVAAMPKGEAAALYRERVWIACGLNATTNTSRFFFSAAGDPSSWGGTDFVDVAPGNGQKLVSLVKLGQDLILFKEHSTHKFTYTTDPRKAELNEVDATIGVPAINCIVVYNNNTIYTLHDNAVYELYQYTYTRISALVNMEQISDLDLFARDQYGLTLHRDRLFVRYFKNLYVYNLRVKRWSKWESTRKFSKIVVIPSATVGLDTAYASSASQSFPYDNYWFQDNRLTYDAGLSETLTPAVLGSIQNSSASANNLSCNIPVGTAANNWVYVLIQQSWAAVIEAAPTVPAGFIPVVSRQTAGTAGNGMEWWVYRKKMLTGETSYNYTWPSLHAVRIIQVGVRSSDLPPDVGAIIGQRAAASPSVTNLPASGFTRPEDSVGLAFFLNRNTAGGLTVPETVTGGITLVRSPGAVDNLQSFASYHVSTADGVLGDVIYSFANADIGQVGGVQLTIPVVTQSTTPLIERFQAEITSKTYDFDTPHAYKVHFWWGISVATSGKFHSRLVVPNARKNLTYAEVRNLWVTWPAAQAAGIKWSNNADVEIPDDILPTLGAYARKFIKLTKKTRYRQAYFNITFDVVTNNGIADASLRVYDLTVFIKQKETVVKETS